MILDPNISEWLNLILRWIHVFAGILWVGQTYYFTWLDGCFAAEEQSGSKENAGQVWMVHSGGFYVVEKQKVPQLLPRKLHWFRWEAALTWLSGIILLTIVYYMGGILTDSSVADIGTGTAVGIGVGVLIVGWVVYDLLMRSPLGRSEAAFASVSFLLVVGTAYGLTRVLSARAAYIHIGALFGTIMAANVWMRILPTQRRMVTALKQGKLPDAALAAQAKLRSKQNTFMAVPVVFLMISNHFPTASYGNRYNWEILAILILAGWAAAKIIRRA